MARIDLVDLAHSYGGNDADPASFALKPTSMTWRQGGAYALLGPSGCGKTTLLNIISGIVRPSRGKVLFDGRDVMALTTQQRNIAQVFQFPVIYDTMTVGENLAFPLKNRGLPRAQIEARVAEIARLLDLGARARPQGQPAVGRRQAEDLARPRPGPRRRGGDPVRRAAHGDRSGAEVGAALEAQGAAPRARSHDDLCHARPDRGADLRRHGRGHARRQRGADRHAGGAVRAAGPHLRRLLHRLAGHERAAGRGAGPPGADRRPRARPRRELRRAAGGRAHRDRHPPGVRCRRGAGAGAAGGRDRADRRSRAAAASPGCAWATSSWRRAVPKGVSIAGGAAGLVFDPAQIHVYADSRRVEGTA